MGYIVKLKRGKTEDLAKNNLKKFEIAFDIDRNRAVIGDGKGGVIDLSDCEKINDLLKELYVEKETIIKLATHYMEVKDEK